MICPGACDNLPQSVAAEGPSQLIHITGVIDGELEILLHILPHPDVLETDVADFRWPIAVYAESRVAAESVVASRLKNVAIPDKNVLNPLRVAFDTDGKSVAESIAHHDAAGDGDSRCVIHRRRRIGTVRITVLRICLYGDAVVGAVQKAVIDQELAAVARIDAIPLIGKAEHLDIPINESFASVQPIEPVLPAAADGYAAELDIGSVRQSDHVVFVELAAVQNATAEDLGPADFREKPRKQPLPAPGKFDLRP